jgi:hypothetical protein
MFVHLIGKLKDWTEQNKKKIHKLIMWLSLNRRREGTETGGIIQ